MNRRHVKYLVVGGGVAGSAAVEAIRRHDPVGSVLFIAQESNRPYVRPPLSKQYLRREADRSEMTALPVGWYADRHVELHTGQRVARLDAARLGAALSSGEEISFDDVLIATGAMPIQLKIPGADLPGLHYLRTLDDADRLLHQLDTNRSQHKTKVAVIGAGFIGLEIAATMMQLGMSVDLIESQQYPWARICGPSVGQFLHNLMTEHGIRLHTGSGLIGLDGSGRVQRLVLGNGDIVSCDLAIAAIGVTINRELLRGTSIAAETAILINTRCETNVPNVYAAGDCSAILDPLFGKHRIIDHIDHARLTGNIAGSNMAGGDEKYSQLSHFWSELFDKRVDGWGESKLVYRFLTRGDAQSGHFVEFGIAADDRIAQVLAVGVGHDHTALRYCVEKRLNAVQHEAVLTDASKDLSTLM